MDSQVSEYIVVECGLPLVPTTSRNGQWNASLRLSANGLMNGSCTIAKTTMMITYGA